MPQHYKIKQSFSFVQIFCAYSNTNEAAHNTCRSASLDYFSNFDFSGNLRSIALRMVFRILSKRSSVSFTSLMQTSLCVGLSMKLSTLLSRAMPTEKCCFDWRSFIRRPFRRRLFVKIYCVTFLPLRVGDSEPRISSYILSYNHAFSLRNIGTQVCCGRKKHSGQGGRSSCRSS